jgi:hypothetical protein
MKVELLKKLKGKMPATGAASADPMLSMDDAELGAEDSPVEAAPNPALAKISDEDLLAECKARGFSVESPEVEAAEQDEGLEA